MLSAGAWKTATGSFASWRPDCAASRLLTLLDQRTTHLQFSLVNTNRECRNLTEESLRNLAAACREAGLPLVWVIVPRTLEIRPGRFLKRSLNGATDRLRRHFMALADELSVPVIGLKPVLAEVQAREEAYLPGDAHWNEAGHRAVSAAVLPVLGAAIFPGFPRPQE